jgi:hypothetical protein
MNKETTTRKSQTDWARVDMMTGEDIDLSDCPEIRPEQFAKAMVQLGGLPSTKHRHHITSCPQCGRTSKKIYSLQMGKILLLFRYARWDYWYESGCRARAFRFLCKGVEAQYVKRSGNMIAKWEAAAFQS